MSQIVINYVGSGAVTECISVDDAMARIETQYPDADYGDWEDNGRNDVGRPMERMLVWEDEASSEGDNGQAAVCEISRVRE
jgi:hypothetical protein